MCYRYHLYITGPRTEPWGTPQQAALTNKQNYRWQIVFCWISIFWTSPWLFHEHHGVQALRVKYHDLLCRKHWKGPQRCQLRISCPQKLLIIYSQQRKLQVRLSDFSWIRIANQKVSCVYQWKPRAVFVLTSQNNFEKVVRIVMDLKLPISCLLPPLCIGVTNKCPFHWHLEFWIASLFSAFAFLRPKPCHHKLLCNGRTEGSHLSYKGSRDNGD